MVLQDKSSEKLSLSNKKVKIFAVAGEESANQYLSKVIDTFNDEASFSGIAFGNMAEKMKIIFPAEKLSVMGILEVLSKWSIIRSAFNISLEQIKKEKPDVVLLIDFSGFNLRLAKKIKEISPETQIHYFISPKLWAWGQKRALKVKKYIDQMYVIHPFEVGFYKTWGVDAKFVGHPLMESLEDHFFDPSWIKLEKSRCGLSSDKKVFGVLLGSRSSEILRHKEPFCAVAKSILNKHSDYEIAFIVPPSKSREEYKDYLYDLDFPFMLLQDDEPMSRIALCDLCLVASGTATLQVALLNKPMAIAYKMNSLTMWIAKKLIKGVKYAGLVNIINDKKIVPEYLQEEVVVEEIVNYFESLINDEVKKEEVSKELKNTAKLLTDQNTFETLKREIVSCL